MKRAPRLSLAFYGDDLTGSTDALESLTLAGIRCVLFLDPPSRKELGRHRGLEAIGVAGMTRAMRPREMERILRGAFLALKALQPRHVHYKVCSTFDSSPKIGSIGRAIDVGAAVFGGAFVPILGGAPALGRYCAFGTLFARMGIGTGGEVYRIDRHPSMSRHPATPATEGDLRIALGRQTRRSIVGFDFIHLELAPKERAAALGAALKARPDAVLFDALNLRHVRAVGEILRANAAGRRPLFTVGPSSVETALAGDRPVRPIAVAGRARGPVLIASGSGSVVTARQIAWAKERGFQVIAAGSGAAAEAARALKARRHVIVHGGRTRPGARFGWELGQTVREILCTAQPSRVILAGGDSASQAGRALGIASLEMTARLTPGAPLCRVHAPGSPADGREFVLKGGQVGGDDYFGVVASGLR